MQKVTQIIMGTALCLSSLAVSLDAYAVGEGRHWWRHSMGLASSFPLRYDNWQDQGIGAWRTDDGAGNPVMRDRGYAIYDIQHLEDTGFDACRSVCLADRNCKGIEYFAIAPNETTGRSMSDGTNTFRVSKCEIHYDAFHSCDSSVRASGHTGAFNGCWVVRRS